MSLDRDRPLLDVAEHTQHLRFKKLDMPTKAGWRLPMLVHERLAFPPEEYVRRYDLIQEHMKVAGLDALLIRGPENITYFSGYETPGYYKYHCIIVPRSAEPIFIVRDFEWINTPEFSWILKIAKVYEWDHPPSVTTNILKQLGLDRKKRIGVEKDCFFYTVIEHETFCEELPENTFVDATEILWNVRLIKSAQEVEIMRKSARLVDVAITAGVEASKAGKSANHINAVVNASLLDAGGEYMGLPPFVLAGPRTCLPHQTGGSNSLASTDVVYFEVSASQHRYAAALMRTIFLGTPPEEWIRAAQACIEAVDAAMKFIRPGVTGHQADSVARAVTTKAGLAEYHRNRLGYSIGVNYPPDWGEGEIYSLRHGEHRPLEAGMTFHMPVVCLKYREFGIGFSETIHVTANGCERLSNLPRNVLIKSRAHC
jgi:Xaa-Pro dipeptidase